jgi:hypothetical protein
MFLISNIVGMTMLNSSFGYPFIKIANLIIIDYLFYKFKETNKVIGFFLWGYYSFARL